MSAAERVRVALLAGTLGQGGAEKQLVYMARALRAFGVDVRVYCLTRGEHYEQALAARGLEPIWIGRFGHPGLRLPALIAALSTFRPHILQSAHSFTNLYVALAARALGCVSLGAVRSSLRFTTALSGRWARWLITAPNALVVNSDAAASELRAEQLVAPDRLFVVPNAIDLAEIGEVLDARSSTRLRVAFVGRLIAVKRLDCFLHALASAREGSPTLEGIVVGDGPERQPSEALAARLGLAGAVTFAGRRDDVMNVLAQSDMLVLSSDDEGFPNVLLEAMAALLPVITTPAGDAASVVQDGVTGYVVPFGRADLIADRMQTLARSRELRRRFGAAGRARVEQHYALEGQLARRLLTIYRTLAERQNRTMLARILPTCSPVSST